MIWIAETSLFVIIFIKIYICLNKYFKRPQDEIRVNNQQGK